MGLLGRIPHWQGALPLSLEPAAYELQETALGHLTRFALREAPLVEEPQQGREDEHAEDRVSEK